MHAMQNMPISFPGLFGDWSINPDPKLLDIGNGVYWYGVIIAVGVLLALLFCGKQAPKYGLKDDDIYELVIYALPLSIIGARCYYVLFYLDLYTNADGTFNWGRAVAIWDGGIAIYGALITAIIVAVVFARCKKLSIGALMDVCCMGLFIGQAVGRWGNFVNREAFGSATDLPWRMGLWMSATEYVEVHPTFLYESLWNVLGLLILVFAIARFRSFDGENMCFYLAWYAFGRFWIEGLRTDSLYLFDWTIGGEPIRVSQALSLVLFVAATAILIIRKARHPNPDALFVNRRLVAESAQQAEAYLAEHGEEIPEAAADVSEETAETTDHAEEDGKET